MPPTDSSHNYTPHAVLYLKLAFVCSTFYFTIAGATKLGILFMYHRIFYAKPVVRYQLLIVGGLVVGWWVGCTIATLTNCIPLDWSQVDETGDPSHCFDYNLFWVASGACEVLLDILILYIPVGVVVRMQLSPKQKFTVSGIFLLGGLYGLHQETRFRIRMEYTDNNQSVIITGIVRAVLGYVPGQRLPSYSRSEVWTVVHAGMSLVCASLPIFKPLVDRISRPRFIMRLSILPFLRRSGESIRSNPEELVIAADNHETANKGSDADKNNGLTRQSTPRNIEMDENYSSGCGEAARSRNTSVVFGGRNKSNSETTGKGRAQVMFLQLPEIESSGCTGPFNSVNSGRAEAW